jgi:hypothetical protein
MNQNEVNWVPILRAKNIDKKVIVTEENTEEKLIDDFLKKFKDFEDEIERYANN